MSNFRLAVMLSALVAVPTGAYAVSKKKDNRRPTQTAAKADKLAKPPLGPVLAALAPIQHRIINEDRTNPERRVLTIGIDRRASSTELTLIAQGLFKPPAGSRETALVNFQLDSDRAPDSTWAVARVGTETKVQFIGLSPDEITQLRAEAANDPRAVVGSWLTQAPLSPGRITLYHDGSTPFLEWRLRGGTKTTVEMIEASQQGAVVYSDKSGGAERFVLTSGGDLEVRDETQHLVAVGQKIAAFGPMGVPKPATPVAPAKQVVAAKPVVASTTTTAATTAPVAVVAKPAALRATAAPSLAQTATMRMRTAVVKPTAAKVTPPVIKPEPKASERKGPTEPEWAVRVRR